MSIIINKGHVALIGCFISGRLILNIMQLQIAKMEHNNINGYV